MNFPIENVRITPLYLDSATISTVSTNMPGRTRYFGGDVSIYCAVHPGTVAIGLSASVAGGYDFVVHEATASTGVASDISGATLNLGAATVCQAVGVNRAIVKIASDVATTVGLTVNGITYHTTAVGASAMNGSLKMARALNGYGTSVKLPHYRAVGDYTATDLMLIEPDDEFSTGLTLETSAAAATAVVYMPLLSGCINIAAGKLSTNSPKYLGVSFKPLTGLATGAAGAFLMTHPAANPCAIGKTVSLTT